MATTNTGFLIVTLWKHYSTVLKISRWTLATKAAFNQIVTQTQHFTAHLAGGNIQIWGWTGTLCTSLKTPPAPAVLRVGSAMCQAPAKASPDLAPRESPRRVRPTVWGDSRLFLTNPGLHNSLMDRSAVQFLRRRSVLLSRGGTAVPAECWAVPGKQLPK